LLNDNFTALHVGHFAGWEAFHIHAYYKKQFN
jgi:hypothetical protein